MSVYEKKELVEQSYFQKMFKKQPKQNFIIELENALYEYEDKLLTLDISIITSLKQKYNIKPKDFTYEREFLLNRFIFGRQGNSRYFGFYKNISTKI